MRCSREEREEGVWGRSSPTSPIPKVSRPTCLTPPCCPACTCRCSPFHHRGEHNLLQGRQRVRSPSVRCMASHTVLASSYVGRACCCPSHQAWPSHTSHTTPWVLCLHASQGAQVQGTCCSLGQDNHHFLAHHHAPHTTKRAVQPPCCSAPQAVALSHPTHHTVQFAWVHSPANLRP